MGFSDRLGLRIQFSLSCIVPMLQSNAEFQQSERVFLPTGEPFRWFSRMNAGHRCAWQGCIGWRDGAPDGDGVCPHPTTLELR